MVDGGSFVLSHGCFLLPAPRSSLLKREPRNTRKTRKEQPIVDGGWEMVLRAAQELFLKSSVCRLRVCRLLRNNERNEKRSTGVPPVLLNPSKSVSVGGGCARSPAVARFSSLASPCSLLASRFSLLLSGPSAQRLASRCCSLALPRSGSRLASPCYLALGPSPRKGGLPKALACGIRSP